MTKEDNNNKEPSLLVGIKVLKWHDYSSKYGLGYALSNGSVGVSFNDGVKLISLPNGLDFLNFKKFRF